MCHCAGPQISSVWLQRSTLFSYLTKLSRKYPTQCVQQSSPVHQELLEPRYIEAYHKGLYLQHEKYSTFTYAEHFVSVCFVTFVLEVRLRF